MTSNQYRIRVVVEREPAGFVDDVQWTQHNGTWADAVVDEAVWDALDARDLLERFAKPVAVTALQRMKDHA